MSCLFRTSFLIASISFASVVSADSKNIWHVQCTGDAQSVGSLLIEFRKGRLKPTLLDVPVERGMIQADIAKSISYVLNAASEEEFDIKPIGECHFLVEARDTERNFSLKLVDNSVKGVALELSEGEAAAVANR